MIKIFGCPIRVQRMVPYEWVKTVLFRMAPEKSHSVSLSWLTKAFRAGVTGPSEPIAGNPVTIAGLTFPNKLGLAAGLDKNGTYIDGLGSLGFGFIEVGTVTPKPQSGNAAPRLFRLKNHRAIINRMGFNNDGVDAMVLRLQRRQFKGLVGVNIGKNKNTPQAQAIRDYVQTMTSVFTLCDYLTVNISSPNTKGLRDLQERDTLSDFLRELRATYDQLANMHNRTPPLFLKVAPDLLEQQIRDIAELVQTHGIDGLVVSNTTLGREGVQHHIYGHQAGGLSGAPMHDLSNEKVKAFRQALGPDFPIIGVGGIFSLADARAKLAAGADVVQIYTGFIYEGPPLVESIAREL